MFGALNRFISRLDSDPQGQDPGTRGAYGFQVLRNTNTELPIEPWFDFIIGVNGRNLDSSDPSLFATEVRNCAGSSVSLGLWSAKGQRVRSIYAEVPSSSLSLGVSLQWTPLSITEDVWHILDVTPNSPADIAGLLPYGDYVIGSPEGLVRGESGLGELVEDFISRPLRLHVYNQEYNVTRLLTIEPSRTWGGTGALGCVLGFGALHRIPAPLDEPPQAPGETLFETAQFNADDETSPFHSYGTPTVPAPPLSTTPDYLIPANMKVAPAMNEPPLSEPTQQPPPPMGGAKRTRPQHHHSAIANDMDAYLAEGEAKSREQDYSASPKPSASALAPPPKAGGPPRAASPAKAETKTEEDAPVDSSTPDGKS